ncbi:MAG: trehalose-phosphatase, partial [bacterium]|nr:trehalose-phosphatase [bacterium]
AIISGRSLKDLKKKVNLSNIIYSGNHGLEGEILKEKYCFPISDKTLMALKIIRKQLNQIAGQYKGVFIEDKRLVLSFHYRMAGAKIPEVKSAFKKVVKPYVQEALISVLAGKMVFSVRPEVNWNKGSFAKLVIDKIQKKIKAPPVAIFIGDDTTDEDVFRELKNGITVKVGGDQKSSAKYSLKNTKEVFKFLEWMATNS